MRTYWFVVRTQTNRERYARRHIDAHHATLETYYPEIEVSTKGKVKPFLPGYIFVKTHGQWIYLTGTYGVLSVMMFGDAPAIMPHRQMKALRGVVTEAVKVYTPRLRYSKDEQVKVHAGAFAGFEGLYVRTTPEKRICIVLSFMQKMVQVELQPEQVRPKAA